MAETSAGDRQAVEESSVLEQVRVPAWETKYKLSDNPEEICHLVCCRDLDWRRTLCGYVEEEPTLMVDIETLCTMCVETAEEMGGSLELRKCPIDDRECPPEEEVDRMIAERVSRR